MAEYIEKQAAIDELCYVDEYNSRSIATIRAMKPADVRPVVRGEWIGDGDCIICSNCKTAYTFMGSNFCPNCGADMRGGDADGDEKD